MGNLELNPKKKTKCQYIPDPATSILTILLFICVNPHLWMFNKMTFLLVVSRRLRIVSRCKGMKREKEELEGESQGGRVMFKFNELHWVIKRNGGEQ